MKLLITGGAGFVGHHFVEHFLKNSKAKIVVLDKLSQVSTWDRLRDISCYDDSRVLCLATDLSRPLTDGVKREIGTPDAVLHLAAESHVDDSIADPVRFVESNVLGTAHLLNAVREMGCPFYYFSTDEVFGPAPVGVDYKESDQHNPNNPYAASKSGAEMLVKAYANTYRMPVVITKRGRPVAKLVPVVVVPRALSLAGSILEETGDPFSTGERWDAGTS